MRTGTVKKRRDFEAENRKLERKQRSLRLADLMSVASVDTVYIHGIGRVKLPPMGKR